MILHVFTADRTHIVPNAVQGLLELDVDQHFLFVRSVKDNKDQQYQALFQSKNLNNYNIVHSKKEMKLASKKFKNAKIVLHGVPYDWMIYFLFSSFKDVNWVCWGTGVAKYKFGWKSLVLLPLKKFLYQKLKSVAVLMPPDEKVLKDYYKIKNITILAYFGVIDKFPYTADHLSDQPKSDKTSVYLGNNAASISSYLPITKVLTKFRNEIKISCMLQYNFNPSNYSDELFNYGKEKFEDNFEFSTQFLTLDEYFAYMKACDIYICNIFQQTGLGAIYTCLKLGKKIFLKGSNYEYMQFLGCKVHHIDEIKEMNENQFLSPLTIEEKLENYNRIMNYLDKDRLKSLWSSFLNS